MRFAAFTAVITWRCMHVRAKLGNEAPASGV